MDPVAVEQLALRLHVQARGLAGVQRHINSLVLHASTFWHGPEMRQFQDDWHRSYLRATQSSVEALEGLSRSAGNNATDQRRVSGGAQGIGPVVVPVNVIGFEADSGMGLIARQQTKGSTVTTYNSDGSVDVTVSARTDHDLSAGDAVKVLGLIASPSTALAQAAKDEAAVKAKFDAKVGVTKTVELEYEDVGKDQGAIGNNFRDGQSSTKNLINGYTDDDLAGDASKLSQRPTSTKTTTAGLHGSLEVGVEGRGSGATVGLSGEIQTFQKVYADGRVASGLEYSGQADVTGKVDLGPFGLSGQAASVSGGSIELIRDGQGNPTRLVVTNSGEASFEAGLSGGEGATISGSGSIAGTYSKTTTFDLTDPSVAAQFAGQPLDRMLVLAGQHQDLGYQTLVTAVKTSSGSSADAIVYSIGSSSSDSNTTAAYTRVPGSTEWIAVPLN
jgi:hypothetical protein